MKSPTYMYHRKLGSKIIPASDVDKYEANGWVDTPTKFKETKAEPDAAELGLAVPDPFDDDKEVEAQPINIHEMIDRFKLDPESLTKDELLETGKSFGLFLMANWKDATLRKKIADYLNHSDGYEQDPD